MRIGFNPVSGPLLSPDAVVQIAQCEALGYDYLTLTDHIVLPNLQVPGYPYSRAANSSPRGRTPPRRLMTAALVAAGPRASAWSWR
jgi:hypothetical protein